MNKRIFFRAFEPDDLEKLNELRNSEWAFEYTGGNKFFISKEYDKKWIQDKIFNNQKQIYLAVCLKKTDQLIGYIGVVDIDYRNSKARWAGMNIDRSASGKGIGTEAAELLVKYVFEELGINRFYGHWLTSHTASIRIGEKVGFKKEGVERDFVFKKNGYHDAVIMSMLKKEYSASKMKGEN